MFRRMRLLLCFAMYPSTITSTITQEIAQAAARSIVEQGLDWGAAKRRAVKALGLPARTALPDNALLEDAVREYLALFCADTQPQELRLLRRLALQWMERLQAFRPYVSGAVWNGTATRHSDIHLSLFCDDPKSAEIALIDQRIDYQAQSLQGARGQEVPVLTVALRVPDWGQVVGLHLAIYDHDDLRTAARADARGKALRGDAQALRQCLRQDEEPSHAA